MAKVQLRLHPLTWQPRRHTKKLPCPKIMAAYIYFLKKIITWNVFQSRFYLLYMPALSISQLHTGPWFLPCSLKKCLSRLVWSDNKFLPPDNCSGFVLLEIMIKNKLFATFSVLHNSLPKISLRQILQHPQLLCKKHIKHITSDGFQ